MQKVNILIIDDHPQIVESYKLAFSKITQDGGLYKFKIVEANTIDEALAIITETQNSFFDIIVLDIKLPKSANNQFLSGEDLGIEIRKIAPNSKIMVATTYNDNHRINNIFRSIDPEGFLIKNDLKLKALINAIEDILDGVPAYSKTVKILLRKFASNDISLDKSDRHILYHISMGVKMGDLPKIIPLSMSSIERRKRELKLAFGIENGDDRDLIEVAKEKGFL